MPNIEKIIREAMDNGAFENLKGHGQPLSMDINPNADPEWELAFHILKENGFAPAFIEERQEIENTLADLRKRMRAAAVEGAVAWGRSRAEFEVRITEINAKIRHHNLGVPHEKLGRALLSAESEFARAESAARDE